jgi:hypothetical protein
VPPRRTHPSNKHPLTHQQSQVTLIATPAWCADHVHAQVRLQQTTILCEEQSYGPGVREKNNRTGPMPTKPSTFTWTADKSGATRSWRLSAIVAVFCFLTGVGIGQYSATDASSSSLAPKSTNEFPVSLGSQPQKGLPPPPVPASSDVRLKLSPSEPAPAVLVNPSSRLSTTSLPPPPTTKRKAALASRKHSSVAGRKQSSGRSVRSAAPSRYARFNDLQPSDYAWLRRSLLHSEEQ